MEGPQRYFAFFAFRFFDVAKIQPARKLEDLPGAVGIMADDQMAGAYAGQELRFGPDDKPAWPEWDAGAAHQWHGLMTSTTLAGNGWLSHGLYCGCLLYTSPSPRD